MLSKLISYEFKSTRRIFLPAYGVLLILSILNGVFIALPDNMMEHISTPFGIILTVYILALFAVCVVTFAYMINRFYKNLLGDEGYLMFTLPARPSQLIWSKCITSTLWMFFTAILCCVSIFLLMMPSLITHNNLILGPGMNLWQAFTRIMGDLWRGYSFHIITLPVLSIILGIIWTANFCMHIYACLSIGSLANKHRLGCAFLAYLGFSVLWEILLTFGMWVSDFLPDWHLSLSLEHISSMYLAALLLLLYYVVKLAVNFVITNYILSRRLNLQ